VRIEHSPWITCQPLFSTQFGLHFHLLSPAERDSGFTDILHLLPTKEAMKDLNTCHLTSLGKPVLCCMAKHNGPEAKKEDGLEKEVLLAEGARVMITCNVWTSKGM
jgi:hypothetical protein